MTCKSGSVSHNNCQAPTRVPFWRSRLLFQVYRSLIKSKCRRTSLYSLETSCSTAYSAVDLLTCCPSTNVTHIILLFLPFPLLYQQESVRIILNNSLNVLKIQRFYATSQDQREIHPRTHLLWLRQRKDLC